MSDSSLASAYYIKESTWGVTPNSAMKQIRITSESLQQKTGTVESEEIRGDRQRGSPSRVSVSATGGFGIELSYATYDELLAGALMSTWSAGASVSATNISASAVDNSFNRASGSFIADGVVLGQYVKVGGGTGSMAANNGFWRVDALTATKLTVSGGTITTATSGDTITMSGSFIANGVVKQSFTLEKYLSDVGRYFSYPGCRVGRFSLDTRTEQKVKGSFDFQGQNEVSSGSSVGTGAATAANTNETMDPTGGLALFHEGGANLPGGTDIQLTLDNKLRTQSALGQVGAYGIGVGTLQASGSIRAHFATADLYEKKLEYDTSSLAVGYQDSSGRGYVFSLPAIKYGNGNVLAGGVDQDTYAQLPYSAFKSDALGFTIGVTAFS